MVHKNRKKKDGSSQSVLHWKFKRCNYVELAELLIEHLKTMAEHLFNASWNYCQYKSAKCNIRQGDLIFVHDFTQNYLCSHQNKCQGLHWKHAQVTLMPSVAHYICPKNVCNARVTHEILHISPDLKHNVHLIKQFTTKAIEVMRKNGINIRKIVQFTDRAPLQ